MPPQRNFATGGARRRGTETLAVSLETDRLRYSRGERNPPAKPRNDRSKVILSNARKLLSVEVQKPGAQKCSPPWLRRQGRCLVRPVNVRFEASSQTSQMRISSRCRMVWRTGQVDPNLPFLVGSPYGRNALKAAVPEVLRGAPAARLKRSICEMRDSGRPVMLD